MGQFQYQLDFINNFMLGTSDIAKKTLAVNPTTKREGSKNETKVSRNNQNKKDCNGSNASGGRIAAINK